MASFAKEVADYLVSQSIGALGSTMFVNEWPANEASSATTAVVIERGGGDGFRHSPQVQTSFDIWVRATDYPTAYGMAANIFNALNSDTLIQMTNHRALYCICRTPGSVGRDDQQRQLLKMSADMIIAPNDAQIGSGGKGGGTILPDG